MKANEAPQKLYFGESDKGILDIYSTKEFDDEVEYIRKEAFIEKAAKWLDDNIWAYIEIMHPTVDSYTHINSERLILDFKKAMRR